MDLRSPDERKCRSSASRSYGGTFIYSSWQRAVVLQRDNKTRWEVRAYPAFSQGLPPVFKKRGCRSVTGSQEERKSEPVQDPVHAPLLVTFHSRNQQLATPTLHALHSFLACHFLYDLPWGGLDAACRTSSLNCLAELYIGGSTKSTSRSFLFIPFVIVCLFAPSY